ncbi:deoxyguanosinetriphosphate triphosphohydrolase family protein [Thermodesulfobacteriota bacterium B35]
MRSQSAGQLFGIQRALNRAEEVQLSPAACLSREGVRRRPEKRQDHRQCFSQDCDRILHSRAYARYIDKTQVFSLVENDHITHRVLHVQLVSRIARTVGRFLGLNEDLIEAIALGHDIGHPPFGHEGERILSRLCRRHGLDSFQHNIQSVQFLDRFERKGRGWNLCLQVLDGILCHDGEANAVRLRPCRDKGFSTLDREMTAKGREPATRLVPMTLEGCVVRLCDTIAYIGRDIEDAIELGLVRRQEIPPRCASGLGSSNGTIVYTLVTDLITTSSHVRTAGRGDADTDWIGFSGEVADLLLELKSFNYRRIYCNPAFKPDFRRIHTCYEQLFSHYLGQLEQDPAGSDPGRSFLHSMSQHYVETHTAAAIVRDYIAGMTDEFFLRQARRLGCDIPKRTCLPN